MGSKNVANQMKRKEKIMLLKQIMCGSITLENMKPRATINLIEWGRITKILFNGINLTNDYMIAEAKRICPDCLIEKVVISPGANYVQMKREKNTRSKSIIVSRDPDFEPFNITWGK